MTQDEIIRMARECLIYPSIITDDNGTGMYATFEVYKASIEALQHFAALVAAHEREKQSAQEPVAWMRPNGKVFKELEIARLGLEIGIKPIPLYAAPVRTKDLCNPLQDLTDDEIISALGADMDTDEDKEWFMEIVRLGIAADRGEEQMTQEEKVALLKKAGVWDVIGYPTCIDKLFDLVAAHERERHAWTQEHWTEYEHAIAAAEREACANVCEEEAEEWSGRTEPHEAVIRCAAAIRARGEK